MRARTLLLSGAFLLALSGLGRADVIHLTSGGIVRGKIVKETRRELVVETRGGTTVVPRHEVDRIERGGSVEEMYRERLAAIDEDDAEARYELAVWLQSVRAEELARRELERTIELDPDHRDARAKLGYVRRDGAWTRPVAVPASAGREDGRPAASPRGERPRVARLGLDLPASPQLADALRDLRAADPAEQAAALTLLADEEGEARRLAELLEQPGATAASRLRQALAALAEEGRDASDEPALLARYVGERLRPAITQAIAESARRAGRALRRATQQAALAPAQAESEGGRRLEALQRWSAARDAALEVIFDLTIYPDANHGRSGQKVVDERVEAVRAAWPVYDALVRRDLARLLALSPQAARERWEAVQVWRARLAPLAEALAARGEPAAPVEALAPAQEVLLAYRAGQVAQAVSSAEALAPWDRELLRRLRDERVREHNAALLRSNSYAYGVQPTNNEVQQVRITNDYRLLMGRPALEVDPRLVASARDHAQDMTRLGFFAHESPIADKRSPHQRMALAGYPGGGGENISLGSIAPLATHLAWYNSSGHHRNILGPSWQAMGSGQDGQHWVQNFGGQATLER